MTLINTIHYVHYYTILRSKNFKFFWRNLYASREQFIGLILLATQGRHTVAPHLYSDVILEESKTTELKGFAKSLPLLCICLHYKSQVLSTLVNSSIIRFALFTIYPLVARFELTERPWCITKRSQLKLNIMSSLFNKPKKDAI